MASEAAATKSCYSLDEALVSAGFGKFQYFVLAYAGMGMLSDAMEMMLLSLVGPVVHSQWSLTSQQESFNTSVVFIGMLLGSYIWGMFSDTFGRKGYLFTGMVTASAGVVTAIASNYEALLVFRGLLGFGLGGVPVLLSWCVEFVPAPNRGTWLVILQTCWGIGATVQAALAWIVLPRLGWRYLLGLSALPSLSLLTFYVMTPESPRYLCSKGKKKEALIILEKIAKVNGGELPPGILASSDHHHHHHHQVKLNEQMNGPKDVDPELSCSKPDDNQEVKRSCHKLMTFSLMEALKLLGMLFSKNLVRPTLLLWVLYMGNAFLYYGIVLLTTELNSGSRSCRPAEVLSHKPHQHLNYKNVLLCCLVITRITRITRIRK